MSFPNDHTPSPRHQYGDPLRPIWGQTFNDFQHVPRREYDKEFDDATQTVLERMSNSKSESERADAAYLRQMVKQFRKKYKERGKHKGLGLKGVKELIAKVGMLLNEMVEVERRGK